MAGLVCTKVLQTLLLVPWPPLTDAYLFGLILSRLEQGWGIFFFSPMAILIFITSLAGHMKISVSALFNPAVVWPQHVSTFALCTI